MAVWLPFFMRDTKRAILPFIFSLPALFSIQWKWMRAVELQKWQQKIIEEARSPRDLQIHKTKGFKRCILQACLKLKCIIYYFLYACIYMYLLFVCVCVSMCVFRLIVFAFDQNIYSQVLLPKFKAQYVVFLPQEGAVSNNNKGVGCCPADGSNNVLWTQTFMFFNITVV